MRPTLDASLVKASLFEEQSQVDLEWEKQTVQFTLNNKQRICRYIKQKSIKQGKILHSSEVEELYQLSLIYLKDNLDYDIEIAYERSKSDTPITLEGYICNCIKYVVMRYITDVYKEAKMRAPEVIQVDDEGKELSPFDLVSDPQAIADLNEILFNLKDSCLEYQCNRYKFGFDIYKVIYIMLMTNSETCQNKELFDTVLNVLGITPKDRSRVLQNISSETLLFDLLSGIRKAGKEKAIQVLREFVWGVNQVDQVIEHCMMLHKEKHPVFFNKVV